MSKAVQASMKWHIQQWYVHTICGTHVQRMYMYIQCMGRRGLVVKAAGWLSLDSQFEPYPRANTVAPSWCGLGCRSRSLMVEYISPWFYVHVYAMYIHVLNSCFNMMDRVQLMPLFLSGNLTSTVFHKYSQHKRSGFPA